MSALINHLNELNAKAQAWMDAEEGRWTGFYITDPEHWANMDIHTVEDFKRHELQSFIWDAYKDAYGIRPRFMDFESMSMEELQKEADRVAEAAREQYELEVAQAEADLREFKELVQKTIDTGAADEKTALRWLTTAETFYHGQCVEAWVYDQGILFTDYGRELVKRLMNIVHFEDMELV
jgi:hypothetical protein